MGNGDKLWEGISSAARQALSMRDYGIRDFARQLRNEATPAEVRLWHFLRAGRLGVKFRRQAAIGAYIVDFVCFSHGLICGHLRM